MRLAALSLTLAAVLLASCDDAKTYSILVVFDDAVPRAEVVSVTARIRQGACGGSILYEQSFVRDTSPAMNAPSLPSGRYGFEAEGLDASCAVVATGCVVLDMPADETEIVVTLSPDTSRDPACAATRCSAGVCGGTSDGGGPDGGSDGGPDGGGLPPPSILYPWNGVPTGAATAPTTGELVDHPLMPEVRWTEVAGATSYVLEMVRCEENDLSRCNLDAPTTRVVVAGPPLRARPPSPLAISAGSPVGARYAFRVGACSEDGGRSCTYAAPRYLDVGRMKQDVDGDGDGELYVVTEDGVGATTLMEVTGFDAGDYAMVPVTLAGMRGVYWIGDYDADGIGELVVTTDGAPGGRLVYLDDLAESGAIDEPSSGARLGERVVGMGDVDGDGYADFAATVPGTEVRVQFGGASWNPADGVVVRPTAGTTAFATDIAAPGDRDGDGLADLAILSRLSMDVGRVEVYSLAGGVPRLVEMQDVGTGEVFGTGPPPLALGGGIDIDDDGRPEMVVGQRLGNQVIAIFEGSRREAATHGGVAFGTAVAMGDIDGTGRGRIVTSDPRTVGPIGGGEAGMVALLSYTGAPFFLLDVTYFTPTDDHIGQELTVVDLDGDGLEDFFARAESGFVLDRLAFDASMGGVRGQRLLLAPSGRSWKALTR